MTVTGASVSSILLAVRVALTTMGSVASAAKALSRKTAAATTATGRHDLNGMIRSPARPPARNDTGRIREIVGVFA